MTELALFSEAQARVLNDEIRSRLAGFARSYDELLALIRKMVARQGWRALGYRDASSWWASEVGQVNVPRQIRSEFSEVCLLAGMSTRETGRAIGASHTTVRDDLNGRNLPPDASLPAETDNEPIDAETLWDTEEPELPKPTPRAPKPALNPPKPTLTLLTHDGQRVKYPKPQGKATFNETTGEGISWAAWSWNPVTGCLHGCNYCYAREIATSQRFAAAYPVGFTPLFHPERLDAPTNTTIPARYADDRAYRRVFVCSMADLYGRWVPEEWIAAVHESMLGTPAWEYITLTKFPDRYVELGMKMPPAAWVGTSVDEQKRVRIAERAFSQLAIDGTRWLSLEPLREPLEFSDLSMFDWIVIGAQTGTRQPSGWVDSFSPHFEWVARIVAQAREAGCKINLKPNLLNGKPGMVGPSEYPEGQSL